MYLCINVLGKINISTVIIEHIVSVFANIKGIIVCLLIHPSKHLILKKHRILKNVAEA